MGLINEYGLDPRQEVAREIPILPPGVPDQHGVEGFWCRDQDMGAAHLVLMVARLSAARPADLGQWTLETRAKVVDQRTGRRDSQQHHVLADAVQLLAYA